MPEYGTFLVVFQHCEIFEVYVSNLVVLTSCLRHNISSRDPPWGGRGAKPYGIMADDGLV